MNTMTMYFNIEGKLFVVGQEHSKLFDFLKQLGLKATPDGMAVWTTTNALPGNYTVSYTFNGMPHLQTVTVKDPLADLQVKIPKVEKIKRGPSREEKKQWRDMSRSHARNTGMSRNRNR